MLTPSDQRDMNHRLLERLSIALDSGHEWAHLSNVLENILMLHRQGNQRGSFLHCQALWHGGGPYGPGEACQQPGCDDPSLWFPEAGGQKAWDEWRLARDHPGTKPS